MKKTLLALLMCLCLLMLAACKKDEDRNFNAYVNTQGQADTQGSQDTDPPSEPPQGDSGGITDYDDGSYDPASEEGIGDNVPVQIPDPVVTSAPTVRSQYAGATPIPIDPIDKPTPTVVPPLTFTYQTYNATNLGLTFEGPIGWVVDESEQDTYIIYNPDPAMDYAATLTLRAIPVSTEYKEAELKSEVQSMLNAIEASGFSKFSPSNTASRTLLKQDGVYANYTGTLDNGVQVAGRVQATYLNHTVYTVHITYPQAYTETYKEGVYNKLRSTLQQIQ